jgi:hypothetical protein
MLPKQRFRDMPKEQSKNTLDSAVPKSGQMDRLREEEKKSLELGELAEHEQGTRREELQRQAQQSAEKKK